MGTVYFTSGILSFSYLATLVRIIVKTKMYLVESMIVLLMISQLAFMAKENIEYWVICNTSTALIAEDIKLAKVNNDL